MITAEDTEWLDEAVQGYDESEYRVFTEVLAISSDNDLSKRSLERNFAAEAIRKHRVVRDIYTLLDLYYNQDDDELFDDTMRAVLEAYVEDIDDFTEIPDQWEFGIIACPGEWKLLPYITTLYRGWKFTWAMFELRRTY